MENSIRQEEVSKTSAPDIRLVVCLAFHGCWTICLENSRGLARPQQLAQTGQLVPPRQNDRRYEKPLLIAKRKFRGLLPRKEALVITVSHVCYLSARFPREKLITETAHPSSSSPPADPPPERQDTRIQVAVKIDQLTSSTAS